MKLQIETQSLYVLLPSGILIVEPNEGLLAARAMLLAAADHYVGVSGSRGTEMPQGDRDEVNVAVAILSETLGHAVLSATALGLRHRWPYARILIFGRTRSAIEDNLYDARMDHNSRPEQLLAALVALSENANNRLASHGKLLDRGSARLAASGPHYISESDPTKRTANEMDLTRPWELPAGEPWPRQA